MLSLFFSILLDNCRGLFKKLGFSEFGVTSFRCDLFTLQTLISS